MQLSSAAAWLEFLRYAHADIGPGNLLPAAVDYLKSFLISIVWLQSDLKLFLEEGGGTAPYFRFLDGRETVLVQSCSLLA